MSERGLVGRIEERLKLLEPGSVESGEGLEPDARAIIEEVADALEDPTNGLLVIPSYDCTSGTQYATKVKFYLVNWLRRQAQESEE